MGGWAPYTSLAGMLRSSGGEARATRREFMEATDASSPRGRAHAQLSHPLWAELSQWTF